MKEISIVEFNREHLIHELSTHFRTDVFYDKLEFYYLDERKDYYKNTFFRKRAICFMAEEWGYGNEWDYDDYMQGYIHILTELPLRLLRLIVDYYELMYKEYTK